MVAHNASTDMANRRNPADKTLRQPRGSPENCCLRPRDWCGHLNEANEEEEEKEEEEGCTICHTRLGDISCPHLLFGQDKKLSKHFRHNYIAINKLTSGQADMHLRQVGTDDNLITYLNVNESRPSPRSSNLVNIFFI